ncbi:GAF domain-containing protein [Candidatus Aerophobetes bacterium]|uniref:histidine kinase n=1 Tax=Aerophobetes bacterium TaxID=2030807 RepID=A0A523W8W7_UNCAE|nr:MAG: GAF domain-containing protein [Candidatus Aerophobetes bacterium]
MKLQTKFTFLFIGLVVSMVLITGFINLSWQREAIKEKIRVRDAGIARALGVAATEAILTQDFTKLRNYIDETKKNPGVAYLVVMDTTGRITAHSEHAREGSMLRSLPDIKSTRADRTVEQRYVGEKSEPLYEVALPVNFASQKWGVVRVGFFLDTLNEELAQATRNTTLLMIGAVLSAVMVVVIAGKKITHPDQKLTSTSSADLTRKVRVNSRHEMAEMVHTLKQERGDIHKNRKELEEIKQKLRASMEELKKKVSGLSALNKGSRVLISTLGLEKKLGLIVDIATSLTNAKKGLLILTDEGGKKLHLKASQGGDINMNLHERIARWTITNDKPISIGEGIDGSWLQKLGEKAVTDVIMCAPLKTKNRLLGVMAVESPIFGKNFTEADLDLFSTFADEVALALENASLTESLIESRQSDSFNRMTSIIIHDLKGSISGLSLLLDNIKDNYEDPQFRADLMATIADTIDKTEDLMARLTSRPYLLELRSESLNALLQRVAETLCLRKLPDVVFIEEYDELPKIMIDRKNMERVFRNLILNALEAMPNGGQLTIVTRKTNRPLSTVVQITDTGQGMTKEFIDHSLFKPFRTTKRKGMGLGLFSCKEIVSLHGGKIEVLSEPTRRGTRFTVKLPILAVNGRLRAIRKSLGEYLLETESINKEQLETALKVQVSDERKIGRIMVDMGFVREQEVELALERQQMAERRLCDLLQRMGKE